MKLTAKLLLGTALLCGLPQLVGLNSASAAGYPIRPHLPDFDTRTQNASLQIPPAISHAPALANLTARVPDVKVDFDEIIGSPTWVRSEQGFLTGTNGGGAVSAQRLARFSATDPHRVTRAFLDEHSPLFGHGSEALDAARIKREFITRHNGLHTVIWEQQVDGIPVFEAILVSQTTKRGELVSVSSHFVPAPNQAAGAGTSIGAANRSRPVITATQALSDATQNLDETLSANDISPRSTSKGADQQQAFSATSLKGDATAHLVWLPMNRDSLRLCWEVVLMSRARSEMFRVLVDAQTGEALLRRSLTENISNASYRVYTNASPMPFTVGFPTNLAGATTVTGLLTPLTNQPPQAARALIVISALDTNASPAGWLPDGTNVTTSGNNVSAYLDVNADGRADIPAPQGTTNRVFDFPVDLTQDPGTNGSAAVVNAFYWNNWMHDKLYDLGFTESAGNFQSNNFGRGGIGGDPVLAEGQEGYNTGNTYYLDNASFSTPPDGSPGIMELNVFTGPTPGRDSDFDTEVILHEYTHGLSNRRVGGGVGIDKNGHPQSGGLGEGWSDFYSLALLSQPGDNVNAPCPEGPYISYLLFGAGYNFNKNYYFGIRRYPYCTDTNIDPGTFRDIDPNQAGAHPGVPINPVIANLANEIHNQGEIWCAALWDARANLINQYGFTNGNQLILQLVTDGMNLTPANPTFIQARDGILQADLVDNNGVYHHQLWLAFARRGLGSGASAPPSTTTVGVVESFSLPDDLVISPSADFTPVGAIGGPFAPPSQTYTLYDTLTNAMGWAASVSVPWVTVSATNGTLAGGGSTNVVITLNSTANSLPVGNYNGVVTFTNLLSGVTQTHNLALSVSLPTIYSFPLNSDPGWSRQGQWAFGQPTGQGGTAHGNPDPTGGATGLNVFGVNLNGDYSTSVGGPYYLTTGPLNFTGCTGVVLQFERWLNSDYPPFVTNTIEVSTDNTNWTIIFRNDSGVITDSSWNKLQYNLSLFADNLPAVYVRWGYQVGHAGAFAYSGWNLDDIAFLGTDQIFVSLPASTVKNAGVITGQCQVSIPHPAAANVSIQLASGNTNRLAVPASVTILTGQTNAPFNITIVDGSGLDGTQMVNVTGSATGFATGAATISIYDDKSTSLGVTLPASATEGDGSFLATVSMNGVPASDIAVSMSSSDPTSLSVPATVTIPAGQTSAPFYPSVIADNQLRGDRLVTVTAHVVNWTNGSASMIIHDNKSTNLVLTLPAQARESNGVLTNAGTVQIAGTLPGNLYVSLVSSNAAKLSVPPTATILAGQTSAVFNVTMISGNAPEIPLSVSVAGSAPGFGGGYATMNVFDNQTPPAPCNPRPPNLSTANPVTYTLSWSAGPGEGLECLGNGGFETGDWTGWFTPITNAAFVIDDGTLNPPSGDGPTPPYDGNYFALADQVPPAVSALCRTVALPPGGSGTITLSWVDHIQNNNTDFDTNQQFWVEIRDTNDVVLRTVFTTQPGDPLLSGWTQRSADLTAFAGRTVRVAFVVNAGESFLDVGLDDVSVRCTTLPPPVYSVYYGTTNTPGLPQLLGTTTNTSWNLSQPQTSFTTYYWQVVASRSNHTVGPIWQFSVQPTLTITNVNVFIGNSGITNVDFNVTLSDTGNPFVYVACYTSDGTATNPVDYLSTNGTVFFSGGVTNQAFTVQVHGYTNAPAVRYFFVNLAFPSDAVLATNQAVATIFNVNAPPVIQSIQVNAGQVTLTWSSIPGKSYRVQWKTHPADAWNNLSGDVAATGATSSKTDVSSLMSSRFYRVMVLP